MKKIIIHPFLFALFHILFLFSHNVEQVFYSEILFPSALVLGITLLLILLSRLVLKDSDKAAIIISISIVLFFSYGHIYELILDQHIGNFEIGRHRFLLFAWGLLFTCIAYLTIRTRRDLQNFTSTLNVVALSLILISFVNIEVNKLKMSYILQDISKSMQDPGLNTTDLGNAYELRDIYYIILDAYASTNTLKEVYNYDNQNYNDYLSEKGFYVATKSQTNYPMSFLSLASSLNLKYVNYLTDVAGVESTDPTIPYHMITDNEVMNFLKLRGYKYIHFSSDWGPTQNNKHADLNFRFGKLDEFVILLIQTTILRLLEKPFIKDLAKSRLHTFSRLAKVHKIKGPKFIFAHIVSPHPPFLFGANGEPVPDSDLYDPVLNAFKHKEKYLNQLIFITKKIEGLVDEILEKSKIPPIIILQADHGPASTFPDDISFPRKPTEKMLKERMEIFNAYYLPAGGSDLLYDSITPVNTFRLVFDFYFKTNYGLLIDQSYYSTYDNPYEFINVNDKVKHH